MRLRSHLIRPQAPFVDCAARAIATAVSEVSGRIVPGGKKTTMSVFQAWRSRVWLLLLPALALATSAFAQELADTQEPGSVIVFPRFTMGSFTVHPGTAGQFVAARTVIEVGTVCPIGVVCAFGDKVNVHFHWVCPPVAGSTICTETDFVVPFTVDPNGGGDKLTFTMSAAAMSCSSQSRAVTSTWAML